MLIYRNTNYSEISLNTYETLDALNISNLEKEQNSAGELLKQNILAGTSYKN